MLITLWKVPVVGGGGVLMWIWWYVLAQTWTLMLKPRAKLINTKQEQTEADHLSFVFIVKTPTQSQLNPIKPKSGFYMKITLNHHLPTPHRNSMSAISRLLLTRFWQNFKRRFLGPSLTHPNRHGDICPGNICPGDICPYQEYLSSYWPDFDQI